MQSIDFQESSLSLVSWARTAQPVQWGSTRRLDAKTVDERNPTPVEATDDVLFGFSTAALMLTPVALLVVVFFG